MPATLVVSLVAALLGCDARPTATAAGTKQMADTLAFLYRQALAQPERYAFLNRERVDTLQARLARQGGAADPPAMAGCQALRRI